MPVVRWPGVKAYCPFEQPEGGGVPFLFRSKGWASGCRQGLTSSSTAAVQVHYDDSRREERRSKVDCTAILSTETTGIKFMPEVRSSAWSAVQSFPAPDGSRTLRVAVANEVIDALQCKVLKGVRQSFLWSSGGGARRLMTETEVLTLNDQWIHLKEWQAYRGGSAAQQNAASVGCDDYRLPRLIIDHLKCGRIKSVKQVLVADARVTSGIRADIVIETASSNQETLKAYVARESAAVEMCVPLSSEEAESFFNEKGNGVITGIRHSWTAAAPGPDDQQRQHTVEICAHGKWTPLNSNEVYVWNKVVLPHFRFIFSSPDRRKDNVNSPTPWVQ